MSSKKTKKSSKPKIIYSSRTFGKTTGGDDIKNKIARIIGFTSTDNWVIVDSRPDKGLYLIHPGPTADIETFGHLRGIVVDINAKLIVSQGFPVPITINTSEIKPDIDGNVQLTDNLGIVQKFNTNSTLFYPGVEGVTMNIFKHDGIVYFSSYRKLDTSKSKLGKSKPFKQIYDELKGPTGDQLFDPTKKYSPFNYLFMLVSPDLLYVSRENVGNGYLVFLGLKQSWTSTRYPDNEIEKSPKFPPIGVTPDATQITPTVKFHQPLTVKQSNRFLTFGKYKMDYDQYMDPRLGTGEFIIVYKYNDQGQILNLYHLQGNAYDWRSSLKDNAINVELQFYKLTNDLKLNTNTPAGLVEFKRRYPIIPPIDRRELEKIYVNMSVWPKSGPVNDNMIKSKEQRYYNIWASFLLTVPPQQRHIIFLLFDKYKQDQIDISNWLFDLYKSDGYKDQSIGYSRVEQIVNTAIDTAEKQTSNSIKTDIENIDKMVKRNIKSLIKNEEGRSLYKLVSTMERYLKFQERKRKAQLESDNQPSTSK